MINYIGGKSSLSSWIISNFPQNYTGMTYAEPFGGGGWVLYKKQPGNLEVYNDLNADLVNLFTIIRDNYEVFAHKAEWSLHSREMFNRALESLQGTAHEDMAERALQYAIKRVQAFAGGNSKSWGYAVSGEKPSSGKWLPFLKKLEMLNARLKRVQIECLDYEKLIRKYDTANTLFYCDPPYVDAEQYYEVAFSREDHTRLKDVLTGIKGKFILSYYDHEHVRELYAGCRILEKGSVKHSAGTVGKLRGAGYQKPKVTELLIMNY
jgi:DNA adenine methylase